MAKNILVSVIIPTLERPDVVSSLVKDLLKQSYKDFEVLIIDQSHKDNEKVKELAVGLADKIRYYRINTEGTCPAKNFGINKAKGGILLFLDDDVEIKEKDFLKYHVANYLDPKIGGVGGRVIDRNLKLNKEQSGPVCRVSKTGRVFPNADSNIKQEINAPRGGNVSYKKEIAVEIGGFDERFIGNAMREETDFSLRVFEKGYKIIFEPQAKLIHLALERGGTRKKGRIDWYFDFFYNETLFFLKHFPKIYLPILFFRKLRAIIACMIWYGHFKIKALATPWRAFLAGWHAHKKDINNWL